MGSNLSFSDFLEESFESQGSFEGKVVKGVVVRLQGDIVVIDVGLKSEGRVSKKELEAAGFSELKVGDSIDVFVERLEDRNGGVLLSVEKAKKEAAWSSLEKIFAEGGTIEGTILGKVKGGFAVDLAGVSAFLPGSQIDIRPVNDITPLLNIKQPFKIIKMDKIRNNIVVSRRLVIEDSMAGARQEVLSKLEVGKVVKGIVKNITDYGAFVDLGGIDGLLHATDMSWQRVSHPSEVVTVGQELEVQVLRFSPETQRISLGLKQLKANPWEGVEKRYIVGDKYKGTVTNVAEYGAFVELEPGIEGLIYVTEMSWIRKNIHANTHKIVSIGQEIEVMILDVDSKTRRMSLGLKQCTENPWEKFATDHPVGSIIEGTVRNSTEFGLFIGVTDLLDGMVHMSDISWDKRPEEALKSFPKGSVVKVKILDIDSEKERIGLGIKQLEEDTLGNYFEGIKKGDIVTCTIKDVTENGVEVTVKEKIVVFIKKADLSSDRRNQRSDFLSIGERVDAKVIDVNPVSRKLSLSIKAKEIEEEKKALSEYGSSDSGASLGDILGEAIRKKQEDSDKK